MKFSIAIFTVLAGLAVANPAAVKPAGEELNLEQRACKGGDDHCSNDGQCCSGKCQKRYGNVKRCKY